MELEKLIGAFLQDWTISGPVFAGFSGGADSTALLLALHLAGAEVTAVHFQHGIRTTEADEDAAWSEALCKKHRIPFLLRYLHVPENTHKGESCEEAARRLRLEAWQEIAGNSPIFLAHHADDALEDLFLRLARGSNTSALVPMKPERDLNGLRLFRPFLHVRRCQIEAWLLSHGLSDWRIDSTNLDNSYRRNAVRNRLLPLFREIFGDDAGLLHALDAMREDAEYLESEASRLPESLSGWQSLPEAIFVRAVRKWLEARAVPGPITGFFLRRLREAILNFSGRELIIPLREDCLLCVNSRGLSLRQDQKTSEHLWDWKQEPTFSLPNGWVFSTQPLESGYHKESFALGSLPCPLHIRTWCPGDRMIPFGAAKPKKLQDLFSDAKVPRQMRLQCLLLLAGKEIIWLPGLRRAEFGRVAAGAPSVTLYAMAPLF